MSLSICHCDEEHQVKVGNQTVGPLSLSSGELTSIVEGLDPIQVLIHLVLDSLQFGPRHASIDQGLGCLL